MLTPLLLSLETPRCTPRTHSAAAVVWSQVLSFYYRYMASGDALLDIIGGTEVTLVSTPCVRALAGCLFATGINRTALAKQYFEVVSQVRQMIDPHLAI